MPNEVKPAVIICDDDWQGLYVDGKLVYEHHEVRTDELVHYCNMPITERWAEGIAAKAGGMPDTLEEVEAWLENPDLSEDDEE